MVTVQSGYCQQRNYAGSSLDAVPRFVLEDVDTYIMLPGTCPAGTKSNGTACNPCTAASCTTCAAGSATTCATCATGYALVNGECLPCPASCATCSDPTTCATCPPRQLFIASTGLCTGNGTSEWAGLEPSFPLGVLGTALASGRCTGCALLRTVDRPLEITHRPAPCLRNCQTRAPCAQSHSPHSPTDYEVQQNTDYIYDTIRLGDVISMYTGMHGITDGASCAAKCAETPECRLATFGQGVCTLRAVAADPAKKANSEGIDAYVMLPGTCPAGTKSNGTACNPCKVLNCATCDAGSATTCVACAAGYALVDGQCAVGEHALTGACHGVVRYSVRRGRAEVSVRFSENAGRLCVRMCVCNQQRGPRP
jgi:hypothetical protein